MRTGIRALELGSDAFVGPSCHLLAEREEVYRECQEKTGGGWWGQGEREKGGEGEK